MCAVVPTSDVPSARSLSTSRVEQSRPGFPLATHSAHGSPATWPRGRPAVCCGGCGNSPTAASRVPRAGDGSSLSTYLHLHRAPRGPGPPLQPSPPLRFRRSQTARGKDTVNTQFRSGALENFLTDTRLHTCTVVSARHGGGCQWSLSIPLALPARRAGDRLSVDRTPRRAKTCGEALCHTPLARVSHVHALPSRSAALTGDAARSLCGLQLTSQSRGTRCLRTCRCPSPCSR